MHLKPALAYLLLSVGLSNSAPTKDTSRPIVDLGYAKYQGVSHKARGVDEYLGIRFAAPPTGDNRWRAPQDPKKESKVQDASQLKPVCLGTHSATENLHELSEDCLYMNIYAPSNATADSKLPVWFFIQGGGYAHDADQNLNATNVVERSGGNIVFVQINYRVGAFGFLASETIQKDGALNAGLSDQRKGLEWVQKHITRFGGDPNHVVIHGDSAGAGSIIYHLLAYGGRDDGLFVGAIAESPFVPYHMTVKQSEWQFRRYASDAGCSGVKDVLKCLRKKDTKTLHKADISSPFPNGRNETPLWYFTPVVDGDFAPDFIYPMLEQGRFNKVPLLVGDDNDEGTGFAPNASTKADFYKFMKGNYPPLGSQELEPINALYELKYLYINHAPWYTPASRAYGESTFTCIGNELASQMALINKPDKVWHYRYNVYEKDNAEKGWGTPHVAEKKPIFGPDANNGCDTKKGCPYTTYDKEVGQFVMNYWISFIRSFNPNTHKLPAAPEWEPFGIQGGQRMRFQTNSTRMEDIEVDQLARCQFWRNLGVLMQQ
ncbi:hypothetical protein KEM56_005675 [Ascosphaera pollenicola]|nr:hypothetical protein KEM56_005675 [Ascosphaera pollenicola]